MRKLTLAFLLLFVTAVAQMAFADENSDNSADNSQDLSNQTIVKDDNSKTVVRNEDNNATEKKDDEQEPERPPHFAGARGDSR